MLKKILLSTIASLILCCTFITTSSVYADNAAFVGRPECKQFLGLTPWDCKVNIQENNPDSLTEGILQIIVNISIDLSVIAAYLVLGYVIYGGYLYILSGGDPNKVASGRKTLTNAFIGLAIVMSANLIMNTVRFVFLGANGSFDNCATGNTCVDESVLIINTIHWFIGIAGLVSAIFVVYGGISYITASGDPNKVKKARDTILYALIGLAIVALAEIITAFVSSEINKANEVTNINQPIISKEIS